MSDGTLFGLTTTERHQFYTAFRQTSDVTGIIRRFGDRSVQPSNLCLSVRHQGVSTDGSWLDPGKSQEEAFAGLIGIVPGRVLLCPVQFSTFGRKLMFFGLFMRLGTAFVLHPIGVFKYPLSLSLHPTQGNGRWEKTFRDMGAAGYLYFQVGTTHGGTCDRLLFTPERWEVTNRWLDHWLPAGTER
jgi:hypothetical protein